MNGRLPSASLVAALVGAAVLGGGVALGGAALFGGLGKTTTVREVLPSAPASSDVADFGTQGHRLTINEVYRQSAPGVVSVTSTRVVRVNPDPFFGNPFNLPDQQSEQALGSGFVLDKAGHIITNYHVVAGARNVRVSFSDGEDMQARVVGSDPSTDVAVLKVDARSRALKPLALGNADAADRAALSPAGGARTARPERVRPQRRRERGPEGREDEADDLGRDVGRR